MYFDIPIQDDVMYLLEEIGNNCKVNNVDCKAIVNNTDNEYDDKRIISNEELKRGDYINYNDLFFLVIDDVVDKRYKTYYKSKMRKCNFDVKFIINNKLYLFYSIVEGDKFYINENKVMDISADTITVTLPATDVTRQIQKLQSFIKFGQKWQIQGIDYTKVGLITLHCKITTSNDTIDDMENEIADRYIDEKDVLNGNVEPILPFDDVDEPIPDDPEQPEPEIPDEPEKPDNFTYEIQGVDEIMWNQTKTYTIHKYNNGVEVEGRFTFALEGEVADIVGYTDNTVDIKARNNIYYEYATLKATDIETGEVVEKKILIKGLI